MQCEMCGSNAGRLLKADIEGSVMNVCSSCARFGKLIKAPPVYEKRIERKREPDKKPVEIIVANFSSLIKNKRERLGLKQEQLAKKLAERESIIQKLETGQFVPGVELARKIEKILRLRLIEEYKADMAEQPKAMKGSAMTLGDFVVKRRNN